MALNSSNISEMVNTITQSGLAFSNRYELLFGIPRAFGNVNIQQVKNMSIRCDSVTIPGRSLSTTPYRFYGPARNMPYEPIYAGELNLSVILSTDMRERKFFEDWTNSICSPSNYKFGYYDDYVTSLVVTVLSKDDVPTYTVNVEEVYPKSMGDLQMGYDKDNDYLRQDITLSFRKYTPQYNGIPIPQPQEEFVGPPSPQQFLVNRGGSINRMGYDGTVNGFYDPQKYQGIINTPR